MVLPQIFLDLGVLVGGFVDRDANALARAREGPREQAGMLALDVEKTDLSKVKQLRVEAEPCVHVAAFHVVGQMIEIVKTNSLRPGITLAGPGEFRVIGRTFGAVAVDEIEQGAADSLYGRSRQGLVGADIRLGAKFHGVVEGMLCVDDAPRHRGRAGTVAGDEAGRECPGFGIEDVVDIALAIDRDVPGLVARNGLVAHAPEELGQLVRPRMGEFDEFETVGARGVLRADLGGRRIVRKRTHVSSGLPLRPVCLQRHDRSRRAKFALKCDNTHDIVILSRGRAIYMHG